MKLSTIFLTAAALMIAIVTSSVSAETVNLKIDGISQSNGGFVGKVRKVCSESDPDECDHWSPVPIKGFNADGYYDLEVSCGMAGDRFDPADYEIFDWGVFIRTGREDNGKPKTWCEEYQITYTRYAVVKKRADRKQRGKK